MSAVLQDRGGMARSEYFHWDELGMLWDANNFGGVHDWLGERWNFLIQSSPLGNRDHDAKFFQGLAYAALAFYFTQNFNQEGAALMVDDALEVLPQFGPVCHGIHVDPIIDSLLTLRPLLQGIAPDAACPLQPFACHKLKYDAAT